MAFNIDVDELLEDFPHFLPVPTIAFERSIVQIVESCYRWQSDGVPFVVKGIPLDGRQSPFLATEDWLVRLTGSLGKHTSRPHKKSGPTDPPVRWEVNRWEQCRQQLR